MAVTVFPSRVTDVDDRNGNTFLIMEITHTTGGDTNVIVPDSAVSVAELPSSNGVGAALVQPTSTFGDDAAAVNPASGTMLIHNTLSGTSGTGHDYASHDGIKQVIIDTACATGTYIIVVRCIGGPAGSGSTGHAGL